MSAPRGFITLTERVSRDPKAAYKPARVRANAVAAYSPSDDGVTLVPLCSGECYDVRETPEQIDALIAAAQGDALIAAAQGDAPTTPEPLPPLVGIVRERISAALHDTDWPDEAHLWFPTEEARALLAWLDRGRT